MLKIFSCRNNLIMLFLASMLFGACEVPAGSSVPQNPPPVIPENPVYPQNRKITAGNTTALIEWDDPVFQNFDHILITYNIMPGVPGVEKIAAITVAPGVKRFLVENLTNGKTYTFYLQSVNTSGEMSEKRYVACMPMLPPTLLPAAQTITYTTTDGLLSNDLTDVFVTKSGVVAMGSWNGISILDNGAVVNHSTATGIPNRFINDVYIDDTGRIFGATSSNGIIVYDNISWTQYNGSAAGLANSEMDGAWGDSSGRVYFGTDIGGAYVLDGTSVSKMPAAPTRLENCSDVYVDATDNAYFCLYHIWVYSAGTWTIHFSCRNGLVNNVRCIHAVSPTRIVAGSYGNGVAIYDGTVWKPYTTVNGLPSNYVEGVWITADGKVFAATASGLGCFDGTSWTAYVCREWNGSNSINALFVDSSQRIYLGTDVGLTVVDFSR